MEARTQSDAGGGCCSCIGGGKRQGTMLIDSPESQSKIDAEMVRRQKVAEFKERIPSTKKIQEFLNFLFLGMHLKPHSVKSICILMLIYIEKIIQKTQNLTTESF